MTRMVLRSSLTKLVLQTTLTRMVLQVTPKRPEMEEVPSTLMIWERSASLSPKVHRCFRSFQHAPTLEIA